MIPVFLASGFALAGLALLARTIVRRQAATRRERRRLASLGVVEGHRETWPRR